MLVLYTTPIIHADDFGISTAQSCKILVCTEAHGGRGALNSLSILVNSSNFEECAELLEPYLESGQLRVGIHLNIFEGRCCAKPIDMPLLVNEEGGFRYSFLRLMKDTAGSNKAELKNQIVLELCAQIGRFIDVFPDLQDKLRIDSHQHFHMIPLAFDAVFEAVETCKGKIEHFRIPAEPVTPYITTLSMWRSIRPANIAKTIILKLLWQRRKGALPSYRSISSIFAGVMLSGNMDASLNSELLSKLQKKADKQDMSLELLFHPGGLSSTEPYLDSDKQSFVKFYRSAKRKDEAEALKKINDYL